MTFLPKTRQSIAIMMQERVVGTTDPHGGFLAVGNIYDMNRYDPIMVFLQRSTISDSGFIVRRGTIADPIDYIGITLNATEHVLFSVKDIRDFLVRTVQVNVGHHIIGIVGKFYSTASTEPPVTKYVLFLGFDFLEIENWMGMNRIVY